MDHDLPPSRAVAVSAVRGLPFAQAHRETRASLQRVYADLPDDVLSVLPVFTSLDRFAPDDSLVNDLDDRSFDHEDEGEMSRASTYFRAARFAAACASFATATDHSGLADALYEAAHAAAGDHR